MNGPCMTHATFMTCYASVSMSLCIATRDSFNMRFCLCVQSTDGMCIMSLQNDTAEQLSTALEVVERAVESVSWARARFLPRDGTAVFDVGQLQVLSLCTFQGFS